MTCNSHWPAIQSQLHHGQNYSNLPVIIARVFKCAVTILEQSLNTMFLNAGQPLYIIHSVKFQKCGLPHLLINNCISLPIDFWQTFENSLQLNLILRLSPARD